PSIQSPTTLPIAKPPAYPSTCQMLSRLRIALPTAKIQISTSKNPMIGTMTRWFRTDSRIRIVDSDTSKMRSTKMRTGPHGPANSASFDSLVSVVYRGADVYWAPAWSLLTFDADANLIPEYVMRVSARRRAVFATALLLLGACGSAVPRSQPAPRDSYLVLISLDGSRSAYLDRRPTPTLDSLARAGIRADSLIPLQPAKTFPNHYSIATGLYPGEHGIVANTFYDADRGEWYSPANRQAVEDGTWYRGEPIWVTAQRQGLR